MEDYFEQTVLQEDEEPPSTIEDAPALRERAAGASPFSQNRDEETSVTTDGICSSAPKRETSGSPSDSIRTDCEAICKYR